MWSQAGATVMFGLCPEQRLSAVRRSWGEEGGRGQTEEGLGAGTRGQAHFVKGLGRQSRG